MILRNGKKTTLNKNIDTKVKITDLECIICAQKYTENDIVCSCNKKNRLKHNFHKKCIQLAFEYNSKNDNWYVNNNKKECPYCRKEIKRLFYL